MTSRNGTIGQCNGTQILWNGDGKPSSIGNVAFVYDGVGTRLKKTSGGQTTRYLGGDYEIAPDGTVTKYLVGGKQVGTSFFAHHRDHLQSIQEVTNSAGTEVRRQEHKPFGDQHYVSGSHLESKGWIGEREEETQLNYLNARYYDPEIGRFLSPDPMVRAGQKLNRFSYASNNPVNVSDPTGLDECVESSGGWMGGVQIYPGYKKCNKTPLESRILMLGHVTSALMGSTFLSWEYVHMGEQESARHAAEACANGINEACGGNEAISDATTQTTESTTTTTTAITTGNSNNQEPEDKTEEEIEEEEETAAERRATAQQFRDQLCAAPGYTDLNLTCFLYVLLRSGWTRLEHWLSRDNDRLVSARMGSLRRWWKRL
jgi:RHS repeat-associated protein